ncbi:hypothetical protein HK101_004413, partial [Irineochytrium annulatum]
MAVSVIVTKKLYRHKVTNLETYFRDVFQISRAQVYRFLDCSSVIKQLDNFEILPSRERVCRSLKRLAKNQSDMRKLWEAILSFVQNRFDTITSKLIESRWRVLLDAKEVTGTTTPDEPMDGSTSLDFPAPTDREDEGSDDDDDRSKTASSGAQSGAGAQPPAPVPMGNGPTYDEGIALGTDALLSLRGGQYISPTQTATIIANHPNADHQSLPPHQQHPRHLPPSSQPPILHAPPPPHQHPHSYSHGKSGPPPPHPLHTGGPPPPFHTPTSQHQSLPPPSSSAAAGHHGPGGDPHGRDSDMRDRDRGPDGGMVKEELGGAGQGRGSRDDDSPPQWGANGGQHGGPPVGPMQHPGHIFPRPEYNGRGAGDDSRGGHYGEGGYEGRYPPHMPHYGHQRYHPYAHGPPSGPHAHAPGYGSHHPGADPKGIDPMYRGGPHAPPIPSEMKPVPGGAPPPSAAAANSAVWRWTRANLPPASAQDPNTDIPLPEITALTSLLSTLDRRGYTLQPFLKGSWVEANIEHWRLAPRLLTKNEISMASAGNNRNPVLLTAPNKTGEKRSPPAANGAASTVLPTPTTARDDAYPNKDDLPGARTAAPNGVPPPTSRVPPGDHFPPPTADPRNPAGPGYDSHYPPSSSYNGRTPFRDYPMQDYPPPPMKGKYEYPAPANTGVGATSGGNAAASAPTSQAGGSAAAGMSGLERPMLPAPGHMGYANGAGGERGPEAGRGGYDYYGGGRWNGQPEYPAHRKEKAATLVASSSDSGLRLLIELLDIPSTKLQITWKADAPKTSATLPSGVEVSGVITAAKYVTTLADRGAWAGATDVDKKKVEEGMKWAGEVGAKLAKGTAGAMDEVNAAMEMRCFAATANYLSLADLFLFAALYKDVAKMNNATRLKFCNVTRYFDLIQHLIADEGKKVHLDMVQISLEMPEGVTFEEKEPKKGKDGKDA